MNTFDFLRRQIIPLAYRQLPAGELMLRAAAGDPEAFIVLMGRKYSAVEAVCRNILGRNGPVEDVATDVFLQLWRQRERIRSPDAIDGWLSQTARNLATKSIAAEAHGREAGREWWQRRQEAAAADQPIDAASRAECARRVRRAIAELSEQDRHALGAAEAVDGDHQAAATLGLSVATFRVRLHRARQRLRAVLKRFGVAPVVGAVALVSEGRSRAASAVAALWATTAGKALLVGLVLCGAVAIAGWALTRDSQPAVDQLPAANREPAQPPALVAVESFQERNLRILRDDVVPEFRDMLQRFYPPDNPLRVVGVRAFGSEVEVELQATHPPPTPALAARLRARYCTWRRRFIVHGQPAGQDRWYRMNPEKPLAFKLPLPFGGATEVVLGRAEYAAAERLFDRLPRDAQVESEHLRFLFGPPGGELLLPAEGNGFAVDAGRMWLVDRDAELYARDAAGKWHFDGHCPGWWLIAQDGQLYCTVGEKILTRPVDAPGTPWVLWKNWPVMKTGESGGFLAIAGDRFYVAILPNVLCYCSLGDPKAAWVREDSVAPIWPDGIAATAQRIFGHDAKNVVARPARDESAPWTPVARIPSGPRFLAVDGDRLLAYGQPGPIYARPLAAGPEVDWEIVGRAHEPPRR